MSKVYEHEYEFIHTHEQPALSELTKAYELLSTAVEKVTVACSAHRQAENDLFLAKNAKVRSQENINGRTEAVHETAVREQSVKKPLMDAMSKMQRFLTDALGLVKTEIHSSWTVWQRHALDINIVCAVELLEKAIRAYCKISSFRSAPVNPGLASQYSYAVGWIKAMPELPPVNDYTKNEWDFLMHCLDTGGRSGGWVISLDDVNQNDMWSVHDRLCKAGWGANKQSFPGHSHYTRGFELNRPQTFMRKDSLRRKLEKEEEN